MKPVIPDRQWQYYVGFAAGQQNLAEYCFEFSSASGLAQSCSHGRRRCGLHPHSSSLLADCSWGVLFPTCLAVIGDNQNGKGG